MVSKIILCLNTKTGLSGPLLQFTGSTAEPSSPEHTKYIKVVENQPAINDSECEVVNDNLKCN